MKAYFLSLILLVFLGCSNTNQESKEEVSNEKSVTGSTEIVDVVDLLADSKTYADKQIAVSGTVVHVCKHSGKRLHLMGNDDKTKIRLEAGQIDKFERELEGSQIVARGVFHREVIDEEYLAKWSGELKKEGKEHHKSDEEQEEEKVKIKRYREMMQETEDGRFENFWLEGISFETVSQP